MVNFLRPKSRGKTPDGFETNPEIKDDSNEIETIYIGQLIGSSDELEEGDKKQKEYEEQIKLLAKTVNNLTRMHEALAFLNDETRRLKEKQAAVMHQNSHGVTALFWAVRRNADHVLIERMVEIGGQELVLLFNKYGENVLHQATLCGKPFHVLKTLIDGGKVNVLMKQDKLGNTPFHYACNWGVSDEAIIYMAQFGGKRLLLMQNKENQVPSCNKPSLQKVLSEIGGDEYDAHVLRQKHDDMSFFDLLKLNLTDKLELKLDKKGIRQDLLNEEDDGLNCLMIAIFFLGNASPKFRTSLSSVIHKMVKVGGKEFVLQKNKGGSNSVHYAAFNGAPLEIISLLVSTAGNEILQVKNEWGSTPLHDACLREAPVEVIDYLVKQGGSRVLKARNNNNEMPLDILFNADIKSNKHIMTLQQAWYELDPSCAKDCKSATVKQTLHWADDVDDHFVTSNNFVKAIMNERFIWPRYLMVLFTDFYAQLAICIILSPLCLNEFYLEQENTNLSIWTAILSFCLFWFMGREIFDFMSSPMKAYLTSYTNFIDLIQIILLTLVLQIISKVQIQNENQISDRERSIFVAAMFIATTQMLFVIGYLNYSVAIFTYACVQIIFELIPFMLTASLVVIAFAQMFFIAGAALCDYSEASSLSWQCSARSSLFQSFGMLLSTEYDFMTWENSTEKVLLETVSFLFAVVVGILLLNILIAVVNNVFTKVTEKSENSFWTTRLDVMVEVNAIRSFALNLLKWSNNRNVAANKDGKKIETKKRKHEDQTLSKSRKEFIQYDDNWMKSKCDERDLEAFFKWWYYSWKIQCPPLCVRLWYFYNYAAVHEIFFPGQVFQNILFGRKYNEEIKGLRSIIALLLSLIHIALGVFVAVVLFLGGLVTFGLLWPRELKEFLFYGPIDSASSSSPFASSSGNQELSQSSRIDVLEHLVRVQNSELQQQNEEILKVVKSMQYNNNIVNSSSSLGYDNK